VSRIERQRDGPLVAFLIGAAASLGPVGLEVLSIRVAGVEIFIAMD
jgi:hypothetical protein